MRRFRQLSLFAACITVLVSSIPSSAQTIIDEWSSVKPPPAPELKGVTIDPKTMALLMLDLVISLHVCPPHRCWIDVDQCRHGQVLGLVVI